MSDENVNSRVKMVFLPVEAKRLPKAVKLRLERMIRQRLLRPSLTPYFKVMLNVKHGVLGTSHLLSVFMLRALSYTIDVAYIHLDAHYRVDSIVFQQDEPLLRYEQDLVEPATKLTRRERGTEMVFATPLLEYPTAKAAVDTTCALASKLGYRVVKLLGRQANMANYKKFLTARLKAFGSIGHGNTGGIALADGILTASWFEGLAKHGIAPAVVYFDSCDVFQPPLLPAIMMAGARSYIGGKVELAVAPSDKVFECFWNKILQGRTRMRASVKNCEKTTNYPVPRSHGFAGFPGKF